MSESLTVICPRCQSCGPTLLPVRYAAIPETITPGLPAWATPQTAFPQAAGYDYGLRAMRMGFLYVWYERVDRWEAWSITPDGGLWKQPSGPAAQPKYCADCSMGEHKSANIEFIVLDEIALDSTVWMAFSPYKWNPALLSVYSGDAGMRSQRMQQVESWRWSVPGSDGGITEATAANLNTVLDYLPAGASCPEGILPFERIPPRVSMVKDRYPYYSFASDAVRPRASLYPWSSGRAGKSAATLKGLVTRGMQPDGKPVKPLLMAIHDPVGIAHELTGWCDDFTAVQQCYLEELAVEFSTCYQMNTLEQVIKQAAGQKFDHVHWHTKETAIRFGASADARDPTGENSESDDTASQRYDAVLVQQREAEVEGAWESYRKKFDSSRVIAFSDNYQKFNDRVEAKLHELIDLRLLWLRHPLFLAALDDFHSNKVEDNIAYRELASYAMASINLSAAGLAQIDNWINELSTRDKRNLVWRSQFFNHPQIMSSMEELLKQAKERPVPSWREKINLGTVLNNCAAYADAVDRAYASWKSMSGANVGQLPLTRQMMLRMDRGLTTVTDRMLTHSLSGSVVDSARGFIFRTISLLDSGVPKDVLMSGSHNSVLDPAGNKFFAAGSKRSMQYFLTDQSRLAGERLELLEEHRQDYNKLINNMDGKESIRLLRIKSLGVIFYCALAIAVPTFFALSSLAGIVEESYRGILNNEEKASLWKVLGAKAGSIASGISVVLDAADLTVKAHEKGAVSLSTLLSAGKLAVDAAFFINTTDQVLTLLGKTTIKEFIDSYSTKFVGSRLVLAISWFGTWYLMLLINFSQFFYELLADNAIQRWCEASVLGSKSEINNTYRLNNAMRTDLIDKQHKKFIAALHKVFQIEKSEEELKKEQGESREKTEGYIKMRNAMKY